MAAETERDWTAETLLDLRNELDWLAKNSSGVMGLRLDGSLMPWEDVVAQYLPSATPKSDEASTAVALARVAAYRNG